MQAQTGRGGRCMNGDSSKPSVGADGRGAVIDMTASPRTLLLGLGNVLLRDDGAGVHVLQQLAGVETDLPYGSRIVRRDGGTLGLALLTEFDHIDALIAIDAMQLDAPAGVVRAFIGAEMDRVLGGRRASVHQVALADLMGAARLLDCAPERRALIGIQPATTQWGWGPSAAVEAAIPAACAEVRALLEEWNRARRLH